VSQETGSTKNQLENSDYASGSVQLSQPGVIRRKWSLLARISIPLLLVALTSIPNSLAMADPIQIRIEASKQTFKSLAVGGSTSCGILMNSTLSCWGSNSQGQSTVPADLGTVKQISLGDGHACAVKTNNTAQCWGSNNQGQSRVPADLGTVKQISSGTNSTCAIKINNTAQCWGYNQYGQSTVPADLGTVKQISPGAASTCAVKANDTAKCWGFISEQFTPPAGLGRVKFISVSWGYTCAIKINNTLQCWGTNDDGAATVPADLGTVKQISLGINHACAVTTNNTARCWGSNNHGQSVMPGDIGATKQIRSGFSRTCILNSDNTARCWGDAEYGNLEPDALVVNLPNQPQIQLGNDGAGLKITNLNFFNNSTNLSPSDGAKSWNAWDLATGQLLCKDVKDFSCKPSKQTIGKTYVVKVTSKNEVGQSPTSYSDSFRNCSDTSNIHTQISNPTPTSGTKVQIQVKGFLCSPSSPVFSFREWPNGSTTWSRWVELGSSKYQKFTLTRKYLVPTALEIRATVAGQVIATSNYSVEVSPGLIRYSVAKKASYTKQGFSQGGTISYSVSTGPGYNGVCYMSADNPSAYNFAMTPMGNEQKSGTFKLKNGKGSGKLKMSWNGEVSASVNCSSPDFPDDDFISIKNVVLRANF
jgi:hypothetical protein